MWRRLFSIWLCLSTLLTTLGVQPAWEEESHRSSYCKDGENAWEWSNYAPSYGPIELHANTDSFTIQNIRVHHSITPGWHLLAIGPESQTYERGKSEDPAKWTEVFSPDLDCTVRNVGITGFRTRDSQTDLPIDQVVKVIEQKPNPGYPKITPKGGTGKDIWIR